MFSKSFDYCRATTVEEASSLLVSAEAVTRVIAGGQSLVPLMNLGLAQPDRLVDITGIQELRRIRHLSSGIDIGACVTYTEVLTDLPVAGLLAAAVQHVGSVRIRNVGTIGGSIAHADPAAEVPLIMTVLGAEYRMQLGSEVRKLRAEDFVTDAYSTALQDGEILTGIEIPARTLQMGWGFHEHSRRSGDFAIVAAAAVVAHENGIIREARLALAGGGPITKRCTVVETSVVGATAESVGKLAGLVEDSIDADDDPFVSAGYRRHLAGVLAVRALRDACRRATAGQP